MKFYLILFFAHIFSLAHSQQLKELAAVKKDNKWGAIDKEGRMAIPCIYDAMELTCSDLIAVKKEGKFGFIDRANKIKIDFNYDDAGGFYEQKAFVKQGAKYGYINEQGILVIDYKFDEASIFSSGIAGIKIDSVWGFINEQGRIIIQPAYHTINDFHDQYCAVSKRGKTGIINREGKTILPFEYSLGTYFLSYNKDVVIANKYEQHKKYLFKLHDTTYSKLTERNLETVKPIIQSKRDLECEEYIPANYFIFYNKTYGEKNLPISSVFSKEDIGTGVMNKEGKVVFCCYDKVKFLDATHFAYVQWGDFEKATVVDTNGRRMNINGYEYNQIHRLYNDVLIVSKKGKDGGVNLYGEQVIEFNYDNIYGYRDGTFLAEISGKYYIVNLNGYKSEPLPFYINKCLFFEKVIIVESGLKYGVLDYKGNVLFEPQFDRTINFFPNSIYSR